MVAPLSLAAADAALLGWNNLGMHCMDSDYSVFSILPPYNTIEAQLIVNGTLVTSGSGYSVTYQAVADPDGSINRTSIGKGNFYTYTPYLYGALAPDLGLAGWAMPGAANTPQGMRFETNNSPAAGVSTPVNWFRGEGIPMSPYDDAMHKNEYPLMRLVARDAANQVVATSDIVLPISDEMDCRACHASGTVAAAQPSAGWVFNANPERDYRLNILRLHDELQFASHAAEYAAALTARGFNPAGLYANVATDGHPVTCSACHLSEALPGTGVAGIPPLTAAVHTLHANVVDPILQIPLNSAGNRAACYRCHPGSTTKCLRGAMGRAIAADGSQEMQCQSCHGNLTEVGSPTRVGWFQEPQCQSCHTGTATHNNGQIRYTSVFTDASFTVRSAVDQTFATTPNTPASGLSLYRFSVGHGGLQCEACHGSTHAVFPTSQPNDNLYSQELQGHPGMIAECTACHVTMPTTVTGGPHGLHPIGPGWVSQHEGAVEHGGTAQCQACHGADYRGTVLSLAKADRTIGGQTVFRGAIIGCYMCHNGPGGEGSPGPAPSVSDVSVATAMDNPVAITLPATGTGLTLRIISQAGHGAVGLINGVATYYPDAGFVGVDTFTFAAYNGSRNSNLGTGSITVGAGGVLPPAITTQPLGQTVSVGGSVTFSVVATGTAPLGYQWQKDGTNLPGATAASLVLSSVTTADAGVYTVVVTNSAGSVTSTNATLVVNGNSAVAPSITTQPASQTVSAGANVTFAVVATGTAPLEYQWQKNGADIPGATSAALTLTAVTAAAAGNYRVVVSNGAGSVTSATATLTVTSTAVTVVLTSPLNGAVYREPANVSLAASVSPRGSVSRVQFYDGTSLVGTDYSAPYAVTARNLGSGIHVFTARARTNSGITVTSPPVQITVGSGNLRRSED